MQIPNITLKAGMVTDLESSPFLEGVDVVSPAILVLIFTVVET